MSVPPPLEDPAATAPHAVHADDQGVARLLGRIAVASVVVLVLMAALTDLAPWVTAMRGLRPIARALVATGAAGALFGSVLLAVGAEIACLVMMAGRREGDDARTIKRVQATVMPLFAIAAGWLAWALRPAFVQPAPQDCYVLAGVLALLAFLALVAERWIAAIRPAALAEAPSLRALALLSVAALALSALVQVALGAGLFAAAWGATAVTGMVIGTSIELAARGSARWFLPAAAVAAARAPVASLAAQVLAGSVSRGGFAAPLRAQLGIDFSRSWALVYLRAAALPALALTALFCWALSGLVLIENDRRGVYERLGAPAGVLKPGLHLILPWPLGVARRVEFGIVHEIAIGGETGAVPPSEKTDAEGPTPSSAARLWDQAHPGEVSTLVASATEGRQSFQIVNADIRILYRVGLTDENAIRAATLVLDPAALVRRIAGRRSARAFAVSTLATLMGEQREMFGETLRASIAADLEPFRSGLEIVGVVVEAVHPPAGAAAAYHEVQAAAIKARTAIAEAQGRARSVANEARQQTRQIADSAQAQAAERVQAAQAERVRFDADRTARDAGGRVFLTERYFAALVAGFAKTPLVILDDRLGAPNAPVIDLRPLAGTAAPPLDDPN